MPIMPVKALLNIKMYLTKRNNVNRFFLLGYIEKLLLHVGPSASGLVIDEVG